MTAATIHIPLHITNPTVVACMYTRLSDAVHGMMRRQMYMDDADIALVHVLQAVVALAQHPTAPFVFSAGLDGKLQQWDLRTGTSHCRS